MCWLLLQYYRHDTKQIWLWCLLGNVVVILLTEFKFIGAKQVTKTIQVTIRPDLCLKSRNTEAFYYNEVCL